MRITNYIFIGYISVLIIKVVCCLLQTSFGLAMMLPLDKEVLFGLLCVACVPGGGISHVAVIIADGDIALSLTMNLINVVAILGMRFGWLYAECGCCMWLYAEYGCCMWLYAECGCSMWLYAECGCSIVCAVDLMEILLPSPDNEVIALSCPKIKKVTHPQIRINGKCFPVPMRK